MYVRVEGDENWHYLGHTTEFGIELKRETLWKGGRTLVTGESYHIEIKP